ncbi:hypothetical protein SAMN05443662_1295 [Sulfurivirga caldicuralii]|uniref:PsiF repeat-containing protein n=1 Tax=Sulfurivirga caldicuralii TaxID=364032 RepID=A0A1N6GDC1_9GAMM|nr:hypothetical protein [Sulfurivirga caldicuralii]SIO05538.1 hypothetical protein SAMN05443662_1295 [Sulfurivirga caldicuralii]
MRRTILVMMLSAAAVPAMAYNDFESWSHQQRIQILQQAEECNRQAKTRDEYRRCEAKEREARQAFKQEAFQRRKQKLIEHIRARLQCVEQADSPEALKACKPGKRRHQR